MAVETVLSAGVRNSLLSLQGTQNGINQTQLRLATGKKVNSALDNPSSFFTAAGLSARAKDLTNLQDAIGLSTKVVEAADKGIKAIQALVDTAKGLANQARQTTDAASRTALTAQLTTIASQITTIAGDSGYNGTNLIAATPQNLTVTFNESGTSTLAVTGNALDAVGLGVDALTLDTDANITAAVTALDTATAELRSTASGFGANLAVINARQDFTSGLVNALQAGNDLLTNADINEEGANLLALQTRQQLGIQALSLASQADQAVLRLF